MPDNETKLQPPVDVTSYCRIWHFLAIIGGLILIGFGYLFVNVQAAAVERAVVKDRLEHVAVDLGEIKEMLTDALRKKEDR